MIYPILQQFYHDLVTMPVLLNGFMAAVLISLVCSTLSIFVVLKRLAFIGEGIAHSALGGIALGVILFVSGSMAEQDLSHRLGVDLTTAAFCILVAWLIGWTSRQKIISEDTSIGIFFVASMALGIILIALRRAYTADLFSFLFGSVLAVTRTDVYTTALLAAVVLTLVFLFARQMFIFCLDEELANVSGLPVGLIHYALLTVLAITIVVSIKIVGVLLIAAFLVIPGATARMLTYRYRDMFLLSNLVGLAAVLGGLVLSDLVSDLPSGPTIVMAQFVLFIFAVAWSRIRDRFIPGRQLTMVGLALILVLYLLALGTVAAMVRSSTPVSPAQKQDALSDADWNFFVQALNTGKTDSLLQRLDSDPAFSELFIRRVKQSDLPESTRQILIDAINSGNFSSVPKNVLK